MAMLPARRGGQNLTLSTRPVNSRTSTTAWAG
jgi:hypothetical protein